MTDVLPERQAVAIARIQRGLREGTDKSEVFVSIVDRLASRELIEDVDGRFVEGGEVHPEDIDLTVNQFRRARKVTEVVEEELQVDIGHGKFARAATATAQLNSVVSIAIAANNLILASRELKGELDRAEGLSEVEEETYDHFLRATCILTIECFLFTTPINYRVAWRGTRYVNNRYLYRLRDHSLALYRLTLSEIHYVIRDILPRVLRSSVSHLAEYLVWVGRTTVGILHQHGDVGWSEIRDKAERVVDEFLSFVEERYEVGRDLIEEIDIGMIVVRVASGVRDFITLEAHSSGTTHRDPPI